MTSISTDRLLLIPATSQQLRWLAGNPSEFSQATGLDLAPDISEFGPEALLFVASRLDANPEEADWWTYLPVLKSENRVIGICGYKGLPDNLQQVEIGYEVAPDYRGRGLATEIAQGLADHAFGQQGIQAVLAHTLAQNNASVQVLRKIGMVFEGLHDEEGMAIWAWRMLAPAQAEGLFLDSRKTDYLQGHESKRLWMRPLTWEDAKIWENFLGDPAAIRYLPQLEANVETRAHAWLHRQLGRYAQGSFGMQALIDKASGKFIGQCGLLERVVEGKWELEVGYHVIPEYWRNGYASEAAKAWMDWADERKIGQDLISLIHVDNLASQAVAGKNGLRVASKVHMMDLDIFVFRR